MKLYLYVVISGSYEIEIYFYTETIIRVNNEKWMFWKPVCNFFHMEK